MNDSEKYSFYSEKFKNRLAELSGSRQWHGSAVEAARTTLGELERTGFPLEIKMQEPIVHGAAAAQSALARMTPDPGAERRKAIFEDTAMQLFIAACMWSSYNDYDTFRTKRDDVLRVVPKEKKPIYQEAFAAMEEGVWEGKRQEGKLRSDRGRR